MRISNVLFLPISLAVAIVGCQTTKVSSDSIVKDSGGQLEGFGYKTSESSPGQQALGLTTLDSLDEYKASISQYSTSTILNEQTRAFVASNANCQTARYFVGLIRKPDEDSARRTSCALTIKLFPEFDYNQAALKMLVTFEDRDDDLTLKDYGVWGCSFEGTKLCTFRTTEMVDFENVNPESRTTRIGYGLDLNDGMRKELVPYKNNTILLHDEFNLPIGSLVLKSEESQSPGRTRCTQEPPRFFHAGDCCSTSTFENGYWYGREGGIPNVRGSGCPAGTQVVERGDSERVRCDRQPPRFFHAGDCCVPNRRARYCSDGYWYGREGGIPNIPGSGCPQGWAFFEDGSCP
jgi:hypothetical protein